MKIIGIEAVKPSTSMPASALTEGENGPQISVLRPRVRSHASAALGQGGDDLRVIVASKRTELSRAKPRSA